MKTPRGNRLHIGIFGKRNAGKSSLINALTGQSHAIVSDTPGTTTDPVFKSMELPGVGPAVFIDTAGFDDEGQLGKLRVEKTTDIIDRIDLAILVIDGADMLLGKEGSWMQRLTEAGIPTVTVLNKWDIVNEIGHLLLSKEAADLTREFSLKPPIPVSANTGEGIEELRQAIIDAMPQGSTQEKILGDRIADGSLVLLVMPQDIQAPKGRLILPQVQTIRELLDRKCTVVSTTADGVEAALSSLNRQPDLIITDSQCFSEVYEQKPEETKLTSFSILMAAAKGDIDEFVRGAAVIDETIDRMEKEDGAGGEVKPLRVLIAEACTHVPLNEDIGTVKIPRLLHKTFGEHVTITSVRGDDFPDAEGLKQFDLIIHCGACMFNRRHVLSRIEAAKAAGVPITNYGIFLARMTGILDKVIL